MNNLRHSNRRVMEQTIDVRDCHSDQRFSGTAKNCGIDLHNRISGLLFQATTAVPRGSDIYIIPKKTAVYTAQTDLYKGFAEVVWCEKSIWENARVFYNIGVHCVEMECSLCRNTICDMTIYYKSDDVYLCGECSKHFDRLPRSQAKTNFERLMLGNII